MVQITKLQLSGLTCGACEKVISNRLKTIEGVSEVQVSAKNGFTSIAAIRLITNEEIKKALTGTHYEIITNL